MRIPAKQFRDYEPGGGLSWILGTCFKAKQEQDLCAACCPSSSLTKRSRRWEFTNPAKLDRNIELLMQIEKQLTEQGLISRPHLFFAPTIDKAVLKTLTAIAARYQVWSCFIDKADISRCRSPSSRWSTVPTTPHMSSIRPFPPIPRRVCCN